MPKRFVIADYTLPCIDAERRYHSDRCDVAACAALCELRICDGRCPRDCRAGIGEWCRSKIGVVKQTKEEKAS